VLVASVASGSEKGTLQTSTSAPLCTFLNLSSVEFPFQNIRAYAMWKVHGEVYIMNWHCLPQETEDPHRLPLHS